MYLKSKMRLLGVSALVGAGLIAAGPADAYNIRLGGVDVQVDTSLSVGASWKMTDTNTNHLAQANGGNPDLRPVVNLLTAAGALGQGQDAATAAVTANQGTAANVGDGCGIGKICLNIGATEAGALNGLYSAGVSSVAKIAFATANPGATQKAIDAAGAEAVAAITSDKLAVAGPTNFDASINGDDGRLNFEKGDAFSQTTKFITEVEASMGDFRAFARVNGFYDSILANDDNFERSKGGILDSARDDAVASLQVLDAFVDYDTNIGGVPILVRVGNQVINWGESTFFLGGNSVFNPIDVPAIRRPGAEIKDALLPVEAAYISASLSEALSVEAYYGGHKEYKLDVGGTHFANSDNLVPGSGAGGNNGIFLVGGSATGGSNKWNLDDGAVNTFSASGMMTGTKAMQSSLRATATHPAYARDADHPQHYSNGAPSGEAEAFRLNWEDTNIVQNLGDIEGDDESLGLALRYYAENLNSTEFGFFYQKYTSRIPYVGYRSGRGNVGVGTVANNTSATTASLSGRSACSRNAFGQAAAGQQAGEFTKAVADGMTIGNTADDNLSDVHGTWGVIQAAGQEVYAALAAEPIEMSYHTAAAATISGFLQSADGGGLSAAAADSAGQYYARGKASRTTQNPTMTAMYGAVAAGGGDITASEADAWVPSAAAKAVLGGMLTAGALSQVQFDSLTNAADSETGNRSADIADFTNVTITGATWFANAGIANPTGDTYTDLLNANCLLGIADSAADGEGDQDWYGDYAIGGSTVGSINYNSDLFTYYPEDIEAFGASFNTTAFGWGVQGEVTYRPDFPLLIDTDTTFIAAASDQCLFPLSGDAGVAAYAPLVTRGTTCDPTGGTTFIYGDKELDVYNWDIGTTATFTRSNPVVAALGADLGVLLTEFGGVVVPDIDETRPTAATAQVIRLQGICTAGSDLPLGSLLDLDGRALNECRPTKDSSGALLLTSLQYNNVFGTPWGLSPTLIVREGLKGYSPTPAGSFREGVGSTSFSLRADYQGYLSVAVSYTDLTGDEKYSKSEDQDFASLSVNYAF